MKEHNIDQLFRQKLQQHAVDPAPAAWDKLNAGLNTRRRKRGGYYAAAAAVLLLLSAGWLGLQHYQQNGADPQHSLAVQDKPTPAQTAPVPELTQPQLQPEEAAPEAINSPARQEAEKSEAPQAPRALAQNTSPAPVKGAATETSRSVRVHPKPDQQAETVATETALARQEALPDLKSQQASLELQQQAMELPSAEWALASNESVTIRYDLKDMPTEVEEADERDTAPEKVLALFQKVKHGEIGLADIRQAKDNLLSGRHSKP